MLRRLLNVFVVIMLLLQGVAQANAHADTAMQHCADHSMSMEDCACCGSDPLSMAIGCATLCANMAVSIVGLAFDLPPIAGDVHGTFSARPLPDPKYLPLNPPPIS